MFGLSACCPLQYANVLIYTIRTRPTRKQVAFAKRYDSICFMKTCTKCQQTKPDEGFQWCKDKRLTAGGRLSSWCKTCLCEKAKVKQQQNKVRMYAQQKQWRDENREQWNANMSAAGKKRYCAKMQRVPCWADHEKTKAVYLKAAEFRALGVDVDVDHIVPLRGDLASGLHVHWNLRIVQAADNRSKKNKVDFDAYQIPSEHLATSEQRFV